MATFEKVLLSGSTGGMPIHINDTATPGALVHATGSSATIIDEVTLVVISYSSAASTAFIEWGSTVEANRIVMSLDPYEIRQITLPLAGTGAAAREIRMYGSSTDLKAAGWVNRITP